jgi:hypothetical protein
VLTEAAATGVASARLRKINILLFDTVDAVRKPLGAASTEVKRAAVPLRKH